MEKEKLAKMIRIVTIPPILVFTLITILSIRNEGVFHNTAEIVVTFIMLGMVPILAYPLQKILPSFREKGRNGQRYLAFILSIAGYAGAWVYGYLFQVNHALKLLYNTYFMSVILLAVLNKIFRLRASGHACSITAPIVFVTYFVNWVWALPYVVLAAGSIWASYYLKRHTKRDIAFGIGICLLSFLISFQFY